MRRLGLVLLLFVLVLGACNGEESKSQGTTELLEGVPESVQDDVKIAVLRNLASDDHTKQFLDGARKEGESLGFTVDTQIVENNDARFQELVSQIIQQDYDGIIISHGKEDYSYDMIKPAVDKGMKVVLFDTVAEKNGEKLEGVTATFQDDYELAQLSLQEIADLKDEPVNVIKLWFGGLSPLDRREEIYKQFEADGEINTLETIGPTNFQDVQGDIASKVNAILAKYPEGTVDAIWGSWDEMAKGGYKALVDNKRTDIKLISIDVSNQDINLMKEENSQWISTAAVDPALIGQMNMRLMAKKIAGEETPEEYNLEAKLIKQSDLKEDTTMFNLKDIIDGWGVSNDFDEEWMQKLRDKYAD
ncbi:sugar ABC transporter substrate-binding protein [Lysinibacillus antri]|uniref:ABC transporter substrate-binding protein n=1 Tax=Lysinibacillus antri TaxID=2498145 RepID=A0A432LEL8_9BACI|nr:sugar ABC transporter substrate-binding protein [Lysinibacillus antri]RUL55557.1 ABC transporter substrate-binding protein [Lysinibacillus antri]